MLGPEEVAAVAEQFGVAENQVRRDHLISHLLAAIAHHAGGDVLFVGGTALARTHLPGGRLSEDIDLLATGARKPVGKVLTDVLPDSVRRTHGRLSWDRPLAVVRDVEPAVLSTDGGLSVRVQLLTAGHYPRWPSESRVLHQRYSDAPDAELLVPTLASFAGMKVAAWCDRAAPRDLYDLWLLRDVGALDRSAAQLFAELGPTRGAPQPWMFTRAPSDVSWRTQLAGQTRVRVDAETALVEVRESWARAVESAS